MNKPVAIQHWTSPLWLAQKGCFWARSYWRIKSDDVVCAFYPKTGSTWVRIFMYNLLRAKEIGDSDGFTFDEVNASMPEWGHKSFFKDWPFTSCPTLIKTHRAYNWCFRKNRSALFMREPRDVMVSLLHYMRGKKNPPFEGDLKDIVYHPSIGLDYYMKFYASWKSRAGICIKYEQLRSDPVKSYQDFTDFLGLNCTEQEIVNALAASDLKKTKLAQQRSSEEFRQSFKEGFTFARTGSTGEGIISFDDQLNDYYLRLRNEYQFDLYDF